MKTIQKAALLTAAAIIGAVSAFAEEPIRQRLQNQDARIIQGVQSGQLTPEEALRLAREQRRIRQDIRALKQDGQLTDAEKRRTQSALDRSNGRIVRQKHDRQQQGAAVNSRKSDEVRRILQGVKSGELTREEAVKLLQDQAKLRQAERRAAGDGRLDPQERERLQAARERAGERVRRWKHDDRTPSTAPDSGSARP